jgi:hypothetical protein
MPRAPAPPPARPRPPAPPQDLDGNRRGPGVAPHAPSDDPFADLPVAHDFDRLDSGGDPRIDPRALRSPRQESRLEPQPFNLEPPPEPEEEPRKRRSVLGPRDAGPEGPDGLRRSYGGIVKAAGPAVAQRVVLYEEEPTDPQGKRYLGSAIWRTETVSPGPGQPPELAVRADVEIPERRITMKFSIRRNTDQTLPASHTVEIMFNLPPDFAGGGIANVPGILMKQSEQTRGVPLAGLAVKVMTGFFLIGLSSTEADMQRNIQLLKERAWFDIPVVYGNNRRAILALEKGTPGERAFAEAFAAWRQ